MIICTWRPCRSGKREIIRLRKEDCERILAFQKFWKEHGQAILDEYYGITRIEGSDDLIIKDIDDFLDKLTVSWIDPDEDEDVRKALPGWDNNPDFAEILRKEAEEKMEKRKRLNPTVKVVRPSSKKVAKVEKDKSKEKTTTTTTKKKRGGYLSRRLITHRDVVKAVIKILDDGLDEWEDEDDENNNEGENN